MYPIVLSIFFIFFFRVVTNSIERSPVTRKERVKFLRSIDITIGYTGDARVELDSCKVYFPGVAAAGATQSP